MVHLRENEEVPGNWTLNFIQFFAKVLNEDFLLTSAQLHRLLTDDLEALIQFFQSLLGNERPSF